MFWIIMLALLIIVLGLLVFLLIDSFLPVNWSELKAGDVINLIALVIGSMGAFVAIGSLFVAVTQLEQATKDSEEQRKSLDVSRNQLQAVIDVAIAQQEILKRSLGISQTQQELLSKSLETSKVQQKIQAQTLDTSKAQLGLLEEQRKREEERQARKPSVAISLKTSLGEKTLRELEQVKELGFIFEKGQKWGRLEFWVRNTGNIEITKPLVKVFAQPVTVFVDGADGRIPVRADHHSFQFENLRDIETMQISQMPNSYLVDVTVPDSIESFDIFFAIHGKNLAQQVQKFHFNIKK